MVLYIGNHTSSSKGYAAMGRQMVKNGGNTFAFFTRNPRGGKAKEIDPADVEKFLELAKDRSSCAIYNECLCGKRKSEGFCQRDYGR